jgi:hypothetical protein
MLESPESIQLFEEGLSYPILANIMRAPTVSGITPSKRGPPIVPWHKENWQQSEHLDKILCSYPSTTKGQTTTTTPPQSINNGNITPPMPHQL